MTLSAADIFVVLVLVIVVAAGLDMAHLWLTGRGR